MMRDVLRRLQAGELTEEEAEAELRQVQLTELGERARLDLGRRHRRGLPEVVLAEGKLPEEAARLAVTMARHTGQGLVSRLGPDHWRALEVEAEGLEVQRYHSSARILRPGYLPAPVPGRVAILTAGASDLAVADEARMVVDGCGFSARIESDLGVAGLHRLVAPLAELMAWDPDVLIVAAGMDGVLPGIVCGLVPQPVIGLPVSTGYGMGGRGEAALLTMLQSCATGLTVVNVDNGIGAGAAAVLIAGRAAAVRARSPQPGASPGSAGRGR
jgi:NCAIR mutase (PurE)-related protein